jgi:hypothetical protein
MKRPLRRKNLRVIEGGLRRQLTCGRLRIVACPQTSPPFAVQAVAIEEDTWLILSADPKIAPTEEHPIRLMTDLVNTEKEPVGTVRVKDGRPLRFLAIVHDVDCEPTWREQWVQSALAEVLQEAEKRRLGAVGLPLLGTRHGRLRPKRFAELLATALLGVELTHLTRLWLIAPVDQAAVVVERLQALLAPS